MRFLLVIKLNLFKPSYTLAQQVLLAALEGNRHRDSDRQRDWEWEWAWEWVGVTLPAVRQPWLGLRWFSATMLRWGNHRTFQWGNRASGAMPEI